MKIKVKPTLPQDDFATSGCGFFSLDNSSANPHEQSLQAFRFPVVPQTEIDYVKRVFCIFGKCIFFSSIL